MPSPRTRRLMLDHQMLTSRLANWPVIQITGTAGMPPEIYRIAYHLKGLYVAANGQILERLAHVMEINLSLGYPRRAPQCRMLTPVFHPNFDDAQVCIGDFWAASEGLDDLIVRIGRMICYQEYNTKSPLNGLAATVQHLTGRKAVVWHNDHSRPETPKPSTENSSPVSVAIHESESSSRIRVIIASARPVLRARAC